MPIWGVQAASRLANRWRTGLSAFDSVGYNSNWIKDGLGNTEAIARGLASLGIRIYCTQAHTLSSTNNTTGGDAQNGNTPSNNSLYGYSRRSTGAQFFLSIADPYDAAYADITKFYKWGRGNSPTNYCNIYRHLICTGVVSPAIPTSAGNGLEFLTSPATNGIDQRRAITADFWYCPESVAGGTFQPGFSLATGASVVAGSPVTVTADAAPAGVARTSVNCPADAGRTVSALRCGFTSPGTGNITGDVIFGYFQAHETDTRVGVSVGQFAGFGGFSARDWEEMYFGTDPSTITADSIGHYIDVRMRPILAAGQAPFMACVWNDTFNMRNEAVAPMLFPAVTPDSPQAWAIEITRCAQAWDAAWQARGYPLENLIHVVHTEHPISTPNDSEILGYESVGWALLEGNFPNRICMVKGDQYWTRDQLMQGAGASPVPSTSSYYAASGTDLIHLAVPGVGLSIVNGYRPYWLPLLRDMLATTAGNTLRNRGNGTRYAGTWRNWRAN